MEIPDTEQAGDMPAQCSGYGSYSPMNQTLHGHGGHGVHGVHGVHGGHGGHGGPEPNYYAQMGAGVQDAGGMLDSAMAGRMGMGGRMGGAMMAEQFQSLGLGDEPSHRHRGGHMGSAGFDQGEPGMDAGWRSGGQGGRGGGRGGYGCGPAAYGQHAHSQYVNSQYAPSQYGPAHGYDGSRRHDEERDRERARHGVRGLRCGSVADSATIGGGSVVSAQVTRLQKSVNPSELDTNPKFGRFFIIKVCFFLSRFLSLHRIYPYVTPHFAQIWTLLCHQRVRFLSIHPFFPYVTPHLAYINIYRRHFFVIKSYSEDDVHKSIKYGTWASTDLGNRRLDGAYRETAEKATLIPALIPMWHTLYLPHVSPTCVRQSFLTSRAPSISSLA